MKRPYWIVLVLLSVCCCLLATVALAESARLEPSGAGVWKLIDAKGNAIGSLKKTEEDNYALSDAEGEYVGIILKSGSLKTPGIHTQISPKVARLYLDALDALKGLKPPAKF